MKCATSFLSGSTSASAMSSGQSSRRRRRLGRPHGASPSFMSRRTAAPIIFWPRKNSSCSRPPCRLRSYIRKPPDEAPHRFVETLLHTQRISQEEFNSYVSERLDNTGRVVGAYDIDLDSGDMEAVSIMDGWKRFRIRDVSTAAYFAMKKGNASSDERWRIFLDRLEERTLHQEPESEYLSRQPAALRRGHFLR